MRRSANKIHWLVLTATAAILCCCALIPGESYASMVSSDVWQTQLQTSAITVSSDYLAQGSQTVLLDKLTKERTVTFSLKTNHSQMNGSLSCTVSPENAVSVSAEQFPIATAEGTAVSLVLTPGQVTQDTEVTVTVCWTAEAGQVLQADFLTTVIPEAEESAETEEQTEETVAETTEEPAAADASLTVGAEAVPGAAVAVTVTHPSDAQLLLSLAESEVFPAGTRYSIGYSENSTVLYDPAQILLQPGNGRETVVLLTLPESMLTGSEPITLQAQVKSESGEAVLTGQTTPVSASLQLPEDRFYVLTTGDAVVLDLPVGWNSCSLSYTVGYLTQTADGIVYETAASAGSQGLSVTGSADGITVRVTGNGVQAGTYRLTLVWSYKTYTVAQREVTFYVGYPDAATTGGNAQ